MQYLVGQMLTCLLGAALLGVIIGWAWWGMRLRQARERAADFEQRAAKLSGYPARLTDLEATHAAFVASKNEEDAKCKARIAELETIAAKVPELEKTVTAKTAELEALAKTKDAQIAEHVQAHKDKDVRLVTLSGRVAELEPVAKKVPLLESQLAEHVDANKEKDEHLEQLMGQVDELKAGHTAKDSKIAELLPLAALVPVLKSQHAEKDAQIANLNTQIEQRTAALAEQDTHIEDLATQVDQHVAALAEKDVQIGHLTSQVGDHLAAHAAKDAKIAELTPLAAMVPALQTEIEEHKAKAAELSPLAAMVPHLNSHIAQLGSEAAEKDARIGDLAPLAAMVPHLNSHIAQITGEHQAALAARPSESPEHIAELAAAAALVPALRAEIEQHKAKLGEVAPLAAMVPHLNAHIAEISAKPVATVAHEDVAALQAQLAERDQHVGALLSRVEELQPIAAQHADLQYEHDLTTRKLRMAETGLAAHQTEIASLKDQLLTQAAPLKTMAAVAGAGVAAYGFYDVNEGKAQPVAPAVQDHVAEFEKRVEELSKAQAAKDAEIASLRSKIAEIEAAPDTDARRQILFTAKNAELTNLKGVLNSLLQPINQDDVALRAYNYAKERGFQGGSENEDWLRAERDVQHQRLAAAWETTRGGGTMF